MRLKSWLNVCQFFFIKKWSIFFKGNTLSNEVVYSIKGAGLKLPILKNHIAQNSGTLIGYQGEVFSMKL